MEQRSGNKKQKSNKLMGCLGIIVILTIALFAITLIFGKDTPKEETKENDDMTSETKKNDDYSGWMMAVVQKAIETNDNLDGFKLKLGSKDKIYSDYPDLKNIETGEIYQNVYTAWGKFTYSDKIYEYNVTATSTKDDLTGTYKLIHYSTTYNPNNTIDIPTEIVDK